MTGGGRTPTWMGSPSRRIRRFSAGFPQVFRRFSAGVPEALFSWLVLTSGTILAPPKPGVPRLGLYNNTNSGGVGYLSGPSIL